MNLGNGEAVIGVGVGMGMTPASLASGELTRTGAFDAFGLL